MDNLNNAHDEWDNGERYAFVIVDAVSGQIIRRHQFTNLGYWIRSDRTGEGIATYAVQILAQFGCQTLELQRIEIVVGVENWASRRVAEKAGAHFEGILRKRIEIGGRNIDAAMYSLIPADFN